MLKVDFEKAYNSKNWIFSCTSWIGWLYVQNGKNGL